MNKLNKKIEKFVEEQRMVFISLMEMIGWMISMIHPLEWTKSS